MTEITLNLDNPAQTVHLLKEAAHHAGGTGWDHTSAQHTSWLARQIADQITDEPVIEEPTEWGSIVRARRVGTGSEDTTLLRWQRRYQEVWESEPAGDLGILHESSWEYFTDVEVLRVGVGGQRFAEDNPDWFDGFKDRGARDLAALMKLRADAITAERKDAYSKAIEAIKEVS